MDVSRESLSVPQLLALMGQAEQELRAQGVLRTRNRPAGDYAEYLVAAAYDGELADNSQADWDVKVGCRRFQVKGCALPVGASKSKANFSPLRGFGFDSLILVVFREPEYVVAEAWQAPVGLVRQVAKHSAHVNGSHVGLTQEFRRTRGVFEVTEKLSDAATRMNTRRGLPV